MAEKKYYIGTGTVAASTLDAAGNPTQFKNLGETPVFEITETIEWAENKSTGREGPNMLDMRCVIGREMDVKITVKEHTLRNLELLHHGTVETVDADSVTDEELPAGFEAGQMYWPLNSNVDVDTIVLTDDAGSPSTLALGTHYRVSESGGIEFLDVDAADAVAATATIHFASQPNADDVTVVGGKTYTWKVSPTLSTHIEIGDDIETSATNLMQKINTDTATTLVTATADPNDVFLTANTPGVAGNSAITLTTDGARLTDGNFSGGDDADALVQPFHLAYNYGESTQVKVLSQDPEAVCLVLDGKNLTPSPDKNLWARIDNVRLSAATVALKSGSAAGTGNTANEYELTGKAQLKPGNTAEDGYGVIRLW